MATEYHKKDSTIKERDRYLNGLILSAADNLRYNKLKT